MLITTTDFIPNMEIAETKGMVFSGKVVSVSAAKDVANYIKGLFGASVDSYADEYAKARTLAIEHLQQQAEALNGNAIINLNVKFDQFINSDIIFIIATTNGLVVNVQPINA